VAVLEERLETVLLRMAELEEIIFGKKKRVCRQTLLRVKFLGFFDKLTEKSLRQYGYIGEKILRAIWQKY